ncbi:MAG: single-stranded DNA-binding protein [Ignavibacteriae bacterium]|nr:single-stranded DNA-binding protein [Ignavibacteriota bacterium]
MADLKMPEINSVIIAGNLTRDPVYRKTSSGTPVVNFSVAMNKKYRDAIGKWQEEVCYIGIVAWNRLADSCFNRLKKGSPVLIDGELQSHYFKSENGNGRTVVEVKARRIQFLSKRLVNGEHLSTDGQLEEEPTVVEDDTFERFLSHEELQLLHETTPGGVSSAHETSHNTETTHL